MTWHCPGEDLGRGSRHPSAGGRYAILHRQTFRGCYFTISVHNWKRHFRFSSIEGKADQALVPANHWPRAEVFTSACAPPHLRKMGSCQSPGYVQMRVCIQWEAVLR